MAKVRKPNTSPKKQAAKKVSKAAAKPTSDSDNTWRFYFMSMGMLALMVLVLFQIASHQVLPGDDTENQGADFLQAQGEARALRTEQIVALRGMISDRNGEPLAVSTPVATLWANPKFLLEEERDWGALAKALDMPLAELKKKLALYKGKQFMYLKRQISPSLARRVMDLDFPGIYSQRKYKRFYPAGEVAAQVVGFTSIDDKGQEGIELAYDEWLQGASGSKRVLKDLKGRVIKDVQLVSSAEPGQDLNLSLDLRIQYLAYRELKKAIKKFQAKAGSVVVLDVQSGEVLAMVNQPSFNPNNRAKMNREGLRNRAVTDMFEPGSTVKPFTIAAALESGRYTAGTVVDTNPGRIKVGRKTLIDPVNYGAIDVTKIITKSSQVGTTKVALSLPGDDIRGLFYRVGLGQATGSGFPGESAGVLPTYRTWKPIEQATFAFGHGLSLTALQLSQAYSVLANGGEKKQVSLIKQKQHVDTEQVMSEDVASSVLAMMKTVTQPGGTATRASVPAYSVAGKTGTVHKIRNGEYAYDEYIAVFAGIAPAENPRFVAVVMVDDPTTGKYYGGEVAAPVFSEVMSGVLRLYSVPPVNYANQNQDKEDTEPYVEKQSIAEKSLS